MIRATAIVQIIGKPKEHVEKAIEEVSGKIDEMGYPTENIETMAVEEVEGAEGMFSGLFEVDLKLKDHEQIFGFIQDFNPISIEVSEPDEFTMRLPDYNALVSTISGLVQQYDHLLKEKIGENIALQKRANQLIRNLIILSLAIKPKGIESLKLETGLAEQVIIPQLAKLEREGDVEKSGAIYTLVKHKSD